MEEHHIPQAVQIRNAHVHNLKNIDVDMGIADLQCPCPQPQEH